MKKAGRARANVRCFVTVFSDGLNVGFCPLDLEEKGQGHDHCNGHHSIEHTARNTATPRSHGLHPARSPKQRKQKPPPVQHLLVQDSFQDLSSARLPFLPGPGPPAHQLLPDPSSLPDAFPGPFWCSPVGDEWRTRTRYFCSSTCFLLFFLDLLFRSSSVLQDPCL